MPSACRWTPSAYPPSAGARRIPENHSGGRIMSSSELAGAAASKEPRFFDLLRSFSGQARLALGTRGVLWASAAGVIGMLCCMVVFADIGLSLHRSDVDPQRRQAREVVAVDNGVRLLMRAIFGVTAAPGTGSAPSRAVEVPWRNFAASLEMLCR